MTEASTHDFHAVAQAKLTKVLGDRTGRALMAEVLAEVGMSKLGGAADLRRFADALAHRGGFAAAVAGLLSVHATLHDREG